jgi:hypothetical protein
MENINTMLVKNINEYDTWIKDMNLYPAFQKKKVTKPQCGILLRAFRRKRKGWKLTKTQEETIKKLKEIKSD